MKSPKIRLISVSSNIEVFRNVTEYRLGSAQRCCPLEVLVRPQLRNAVRIQAEVDKLPRVPETCLSWPYRSF